MNEIDTIRDIIHVRTTVSERPPPELGEMPGSADAGSSSAGQVGVSEWGLKTCEKVQPDYTAESWEPLKPIFKNPLRFNGKR